MLKLIACPEISNMYSVPEKTKGGPGERAGKRGVLYQQAETYTRLKQMNCLVGVLQYDMHSPVTLVRQVHVHILRERAWKLCPQYHE